MLYFEVFYYGIIFSLEYTYKTFATFHLIYSIALDYVRSETFRQLLIDASGDEFKIVTQLLSR